MRAKTLLHRMLPQSGQTNTHALSPAVQRNFRSTECHMSRYKSKEIREHCMSIPNFTQIGQEIQKVQVEIRYALSAVR
jgi:hypothetical protein